MNEYDVSRLRSDEGEWFAYAHGMNNSEQEKAFFELPKPKSCFSQTWKCSTSSF